MNDFLFSKTVLNYLVPLSVRGTYITKNEFLVVENQKKKLFLSVLPNFHQCTLNEIQFMLESFVKKTSFELPCQYTEKGFGLIPKEEFQHYHLDNEFLFFLENVLFYFTPHEPSSFQNIQSNALSSLKDNQTQFKSDIVKIKFTATENPELLKTKLEESLSFNPYLKFRIDGNRTFELHQLIDLQTFLLKNISKDHFDYFEEPLKDINDLINYQKNSEILYALDETFHHSALWCLKYFPHLPMVLKPSLLGISTTYSYLKNYPQTRFIISSSYEHTSALQVLNFLASQRPKEFHGLTSFVNET